MTVTHIVLFNFKPEIDAAEINAVLSDFLALKDSCVHPITNASYILSLKGGKDNSPEDHQEGLTHGFVIEFATAKDRDYYISKDPAHLAFVARIDGLVGKAVVVDFTAGVF